MPLYMGFCPIVDKFVFSRQFKLVQFKLSEKKLKAVATEKTSRGYVAGKKTSTQCKNKIEVKSPTDS